jgi:cold shock CspA family protein
MSNDDSSSTAPHAGSILSDARLNGRVKWFNNRAGFGFVTVLEGDKKNEDVFVHHSGIVVNSEQYKYLVQGEYVSFMLRESDSQAHPYQAGDVTGILGGMLMCETRNANRSSREEGGEEEGDDSRPRRSGNRRVRPRGSGPRGSGPRGSAPRGEGSRGNEEWVLTRRARQSGRRNQQES